jgi:hypothetical protein
MQRLILLSRPIVRVVLTPSPKASQMIRVTLTPSPKTSHTIRATLTPPCSSLPRDALDTVTRNADVFISALPSSMIRDELPQPPSSAAPVVIPLAVATNEAETPTTFSADREVSLQSNNIFHNQS